jgi:spermidine/putrescine transport system substrate-binding protein
LTAKQAGLNVAYAEPKEGRLSWLCGFVLSADTRNYQHAHRYVDAWSSAASAEWNITQYAYGHANTAVDLTKVGPELVKAFRLDDPGVLDEPTTHIDRWTSRRRAYAKAWSEVKAA